MYQINRPIRIARKENNLFLVSLPAIGVRIEVNENVVDFLQFIIEKEQIDDIEIIAKEFTERYNITNVKDYIEILENMIHIQMLIASNNNE